MNALPLEPRHGGGRYPWFDVTEQASHWDDATRAVIQRRMGRQSALRFFTEAEEAAASALFDQLLYQRREPRIPVVQMVDVRLAENQTDGWHYATMPSDAQAWQESLAGLDADAKAAHDLTFAQCVWAQQQELLRKIQDLDDRRWHGMPAAQVWSLWVRYACTAFYAHPWAWNEIGFGGPAYPRGYKNLGVDRREPFEVRDTTPRHDPVASRSRPGDAP